MYLQVCGTLFYIPIFLTQRFVEHILNSFALLSNMILLAAYYMCECSIVHFVTHTVECLYCFQLFQQHISLLKSWFPPLYLGQNLQIEITKPKAIKFTVSLMHCYVAASTKWSNMLFLQQCLCTPTPKFLSCQTLYYSEYFYNLKRPQFVRPEFPYCLNNVSLCLNITNKKSVEEATFLILLQSQK